MQDIAGAATVFVYYIRGFVESAPKGALFNGKSLGTGVRAVNGAEKGGVGKMKCARLIVKEGGRG